MKERVNRWLVKNPLGIDVCLKQETFDNHIIGDTKRSTKETDNLVKEANHVKMTIEEPRAIYPDANFEENKRHRYIDFIFDPDLCHVQALVVVVDTDRDPNEVVTWTIKRKLSQELLKGGIIYDSRENQPGER